MLYPGQEVECIDASNAFPIPLTRGGTYIVEEVFPPETYIENVGWSISLVGIVFDYDFLARRFRPVTRKTDIAQFEKYLDVKVPENKLLTRS